VDTALDRAMSWYHRRTQHHTEWPAERVAAERLRTISVCLPARNEASTIGAILDALVPLVDRGVIDEVVVVDDSSDGTAEVARERGAKVYRQEALCSEFGPVLGKGDAMWRALTILEGEVVCFLDADSEEAGPHYACGLVGPVACRDDVQFAKGFYRRPLLIEGVRLPEGGGRVTELSARPLLNAFFPELAGIRQPLAGEIAARRDLLMRLPFATGYAVDVALLVDVWRAVGLDGLAQIDLDVRQNRHHPLAALMPMAAAVLHALIARMEDDGRLVGDVERRLLMPHPGGLACMPAACLERPPLRPAVAA
jgi:glucosyl-3-phosphoglycerate synthase